MRLFGLASLALVVAAAAPAGADEWSHRYPLKGRADLHVRTDDGSVRVESGASSEIEARVTTDGWRLAPGEVSIKESQTGDRVEIEVLLPKMRGWHWSGHRSIEVALRVPANADLEVHTGDGSITAGAVEGRVSLSSGDGSITADALRGEIRLHTGDGSIRASGLAGQLQADTGDGHMSVSGRFDALDLRTGDGGIEATADAGSKVASAWSLSSGDGSVTLKVPADLGADLDARTGDGGIHLDAPIAVKGTVRDNSVRGQLGPGGGPLRIHTGDGSIRISGR